MLVPNLLVSAVVVVDQTSAAAFIGTRTEASVFAVESQTNADETADETAALTAAAWTNATDARSSSGLAILEVMQHFHGKSKFTVAKELVTRRLERELQLPQTQTDKRGLALITALFMPAFFGIDRCYMGQYLLGTLKAMTFGGCAIWALLDWCYVMYSCLTEAQMMDHFLFRASFTDSSLYGARCIALAGICAFWAVSKWAPDRRHESGCTSDSEYLYARKDGTR
jgi:TM2 domain-containing membrane protein YozV